MFLPDIRFCAPEHVELLWEVNAASPHPWPPRVIAQDLRSESGLSYLGAFTPPGDRLLGYAVWGNEKNDALLMNLVVLPEFRRRGIGTQLVLAVAVCAEDRGYRSLVLRVRSGNVPAQTLYRELGFQEKSTQKAYYSDGDDACCMGIPLPLPFESDGPEP